MFLEVKSPERAEPWVKERRWRNKEKDHGLRPSRVQTWRFAIEGPAQLCDEIGQRSGTSRIRVKIGEALEKVMRRKRPVSPRRSLCRAVAVLHAGDSVGSEHTDLRLLARERVERRNNHRTARQESADPTERDLHRRVGATIQAACTAMSTAACGARRSGNSRS